ncbi:MAG: prepilin-type N-terminal cleavage/methylation domain-containing protein [Deltaproteobacteria bacterium]|nr:prepilin-type N-terminal cleavage/methylation domain-containing protein [Deltaproteobacteria bacterium]
MPKAALDVECRLVRRPRAGTRQIRTGFSLLEVAVASAIAGIVAAAALSSFAVLNRQLVRLQAETSASDDAKTLVDFLVSDLQAVGGGAVRPWMAMQVDNGADTGFIDRCPNFGQTICGPADRVTYGLLVPTKNSVCRIAAIDDGTKTIGGDGAGANCCLSLMMLRAGFDSRAPPTSGLPTLLDLKLHTVAVSPTGFHRQLSLENVDPITCTAKFSAGPLAGVDDPGVIAQFVNGTVSAVRVRTLYVDESRHELLSFEDKRGFNGADVLVDADEVSKVASHVHDFQVQLGYDSDGVTPGIIVDRSSNTDEWQFNAAADGAFPPNALRMTGVGIIVGVNVKDPSYSSSAQVIGGDPKSVSGIHLRGAMGKAALRNIFVFF